MNAAERDRYADQAEYYAENWQQVDPILVAIKRESRDGKGAERIGIDAFITPMNDFKYHFLLSLLGKPSKYRLVPPQHNIVSIDAAVRGGIWFPGVPAHRLFLGLQDQLPLATPRPYDALRLLQIVRAAPAYLGAWPKPGFLDLLPLGLAGEVDEAGFSQLPLGVIRWQGRDFSVLSLDRDILDAASRQLGFVEEDQAVQVRVHVGDLSQAKFGDWLNTMGYERARQISVANARFIGILTQQLHVPPTDALHVAEDLLDARLVCALGGKYEMVSRGDANVWRSTAWADDKDYQRPADYVTPPLDWFRGLDARLVKYPDRLVVRANVNLQRKERTPMFQLPFLGRPDAVPDEHEERDKKQVIPADKVDERRQR